MLIASAQRFVCLLIQSQIEEEKKRISSRSAFIAITQIPCTLLLLFLLLPWVFACMSRLAEAVGQISILQFSAKSFLQVKGYFTFSPIWMCLYNLPLPLIYQNVMEQVEPWLKRFLSLGSSSERAEWDGRVELIYAKPAATLIFSGHRGETDCHHFKMKKAANKSVTWVRDLPFQTWPPPRAPDIF